MIFQIFFRRNVGRELRHKCSRAMDPGEAPRAHVERNPVHDCRRCRLEQCRSGDVSRRYEHYSHPSTTNDRPFVCPVICTYMNSQCFFIDFVVSNIVEKFQRNCSCPSAQKLQVFYWVMKTIKSVERFTKGREVCLRQHFRNTCILH